MHAGTDQFFMNPAMAPHPPRMMMAYWRSTIIAAHIDSSGNLRANLSVEETWTGQSTGVCMTKTGGSPTCRKFQILVPDFFTECGHTFELSL